ncbi:MAG: hypothetical protein J2P17_04925, partial [Mycobacterium sp.]|nr:hypothetical protein [Mycobacterium sp.]
MVYEAKKNMTRGESAPVTAAVTLDQKTPAVQILHRSATADEENFLVSCTVQARLTASTYEFEIDPADGVDRSFLITDTAQWSWFVTPKTGGNHTLVLQLHPIVEIRAEAANRESATAESDSNSKEYETNVHVTVPWRERIQETMSSLAATFHVAEGLIEAITSTAVALLGLLAAIG